ncbi:hypothetical protein GCM10027051_32710 [Niabella terrae]
MKRFNIHNLIIVEIDDELEDTNRIYDFLNSINTTRSVSTSPFKISVNKVNSIDKSLHREYSNGIYTNEKSIIDSRYGIEVVIKDKEILLNTKFRFIEWLVYCFQLALLKQDAVLVHGAAVSYEGKALLFPSWGGVGKTAILNDFVKKYNFKVIGDDLFILTKEGNVLSFPKTMVLYPYHKKLFPEVFSKSPNLVPAFFTKQLSRIVPKIKKLLSPFPVLMNYFRNRNPQIKWALPYEVFGDKSICQESIASEVYWLERSSNRSNITNENNAIYSQILGSTINEFDQRIIYSVNAIMGVGVLSYEDYLGRWYSVLKAGLNNCKKGRIEVNHSVSIDEIGDFMYNILKGQINE